MERIVLFVQVSLLAVGLTFSHHTLAQMPDFYSEAASVSDRGGVSEAPNEVIDPFSGTLNLIHNDVVIPGNGGLDITVQRVYSSQNVYYRKGQESALTTLQTRNPYGQGWSMHFGRIRLPIGEFKQSCNDGNVQNDVTDNPVLETQDGKQHQLFCNSFPNTYNTNANFVSKNNWVASYLTNDRGFLVIDPNGTKYVMEYKLRGGTNDVPTDDVWYTTYIEDRNGNYLRIYYDDNSEGENVIFNRIDASDGRRVSFVYANRTSQDRVLLSQIRYGSKRWTYSYRRIFGYNDAADRDYYLLDEVDLPGTNTGKWNYSYHNRSTGSAGDNMLRTVTYPYGATTTYDYQYHCFMYENCSNNSRYHSIVVKSKINDGRSIAKGTWTFAYSEANTFDTTTVTGPTYREIYKHFGQYQNRFRIEASPVLYDNNNDGLWKVGLLAEKKITTRSGALIQQENYTYGARAISNEYYSRFPYTRAKQVSDPDVFQSYMTEKRITRNGKTYITQYQNFNDNINPHRIVETGQATRTTNLTYYPRINGQNIVSQVKDETLGSSTNRKITRSFDSKGNLTEERKYGVLTRFGYDRSGNLTSVRNARGKTTTFSNYYRGIARTERQPEGVTINRSVDIYGNITEVRDGRGFETQYDYDLRDRLTSIDYPIGSSVNINWSSTGRILTRGSYTQAVTLDGFGRTICTRSENVYVGEGYNAAGNRVYETYPNFSGCASTTRTTYSYDALNRLVRTTHPDGSYQELTYLNNNVIRLRDERGQLFTNTHRSYSDPDNRELIKMTGPENLSLTIGRNILGQPTSVNRNGVNRTYNYGSSIFLLSENNPETGTTNYGRDAVGNMTSKRTGGVTTSYTYDDLSRLKVTNYPSGTPDIARTYDKNNNLKTINSGITRFTYSYDGNNNLIREQQQISGRNYFINYVYNGLDYLSSMTYPDGGIISYFPNDLGWATKAAPYISNVTYNASGQPTKLTYQNGRTTTQTYWARRWPRRTIVDGGISDRERRYDFAGNMLGVDDRLNNRFDRSMTYDGLNRLKTANGAWGGGTVNYSTDDDILTKNMGTQRLSYGYSGNKVSSVSGLKNFITRAEYRYDRYGNIIQKANSNTGWTYQYDHASNLRKVFNRSGTQLRSYDYSGEKQRVRSVKSGETRIHITSKDGLLLNEFVTQGSKPSITNMYLGTRLIAELESGSGAPASIFGWGFGNSANKYNYSRTFSLDRLPTSLKYCVTGYAISTNEVSVKINGVFIGYLKPGNPIETCFDVNKSQLRLGSNTVLFTQTKPVQTWGVGRFETKPFFAASIVPPVMLLLNEEGN